MRLGNERRGHTAAPSPSPPRVSLVPVPGTAELSLHKNSLEILCTLAACLVRALGQVQDFKVPC